MDVTWCIPRFRTLFSHLFCFWRENLDHNLLFHSFSYLLIRVSFWYFLIFILFPYILLLHNKIYPTNPLRETYTGNLFRYTEKESYDKVTHTCLFRSWDSSLTWTVQTCCSYLGYTTFESLLTPFTTFPVSIFTCFFSLVYPGSSFKIRFT